MVPYVCTPAAPEVLARSPKKKKYRNFTSMADEYQVQSIFKNITHRSNEKNHVKRRNFILIQVCCSDFRY